MAITCGFETGTNGNTIATTDAGDATAWNVVGSTPNYDNARAKEGTLSGAYTSSESTEWTTAFGTQTDHFGRLYLYLTGNPSADTDFIRTRNSGTDAIKIRLEADGQLDLHAGGGVRATSTNAAPLDQWVRIEWHFTHSATSAAGELKIFHSPDSTTATETISFSGVASQASADRIRVGVIGAVTCSLWLDLIVAADTAYPGPAGGGVDNQPPPGGALAQGQSPAPGCDFSLSG